MRSHKRSICLTLLTFLFVLNAQAQYARITPDAEQPAVWSLFAGQQLAQALESPSAEIRIKALEHLILFARTFGDDLDLSDATPALVSIYNEDADAQCRLAAVVGLHAIGDPRGLQQMRLGLASQSAERVQHAAIAALVDAFGLHTFDGAKDIAAIAERVAAYYKTERTMPPFIAQEYR